MSEEFNYVFLHGGMQGGWVWNETLAALVQQTSGHFGRALVLDVPGCGSKRARRGEDMSPAEIADEFLEEITAAGMHDVILVGHSQAGTILPFMLAAQPRRFRRAIYISSIAPPAGASLMQFSQTLHHPPIALGQPPDFAALFCNDMNATQQRAFLGKLGKDAWPPRNYQTTAWRYDAHDVPTSYVYCLRDACVPLVAQEICAERLMANRSVRIDAGHQVMNTRPHALAEVLRHEARAQGRDSADS